MKKEEFPTFLNEQPRVVFGRTARELLFITCGIIASWYIWSDTGVVLGSPEALFLRITLSAIPVVLGLIVALVSLGYRPLEEWLLIWLFYTLMPKLYLYKPVEEDEEQEAEKGKSKRRHRRDAETNDTEED